MISYSNIGYFGRLGNQMFQFAATYGIAKKLGYEVYFPAENVREEVIESFHDGKTLGVAFDIPKVFKLKDDLLINRKNISTMNKVGENFFHFDDTMFLVKDSTDLTGYYQSEKYFKHVEDEIRDLFTFQDSIQQTANKLFPAVNGTTVAIHVRRGDYVNQQQFHPTCTPDYYIEAARLFEDYDPYFIIFSDDVDYCRKLFAESENILYINNIDPYVDLCLMSMCDHNIIANSSFSWWGAWLNKNPNKKVVAPRSWFGPAYAFHNTQDLYCTNWIIK